MAVVVGTETLSGSELAFSSGLCLMRAAFAFVETSSRHCRRKSSSSELAGKVMFLHKERGTIFSRRSLVSNKACSSR